jgi:hypothetical protein
MAGDKAKFVVEPVGIGASLVGRELHQIAATRLSFCDRPLEHLLPQARITPVRSNAHRFYLSPPRTHSRNARNECELQPADHFAVIRNDYEALIGVGVYGFECGDVSCIERRAHVFALTAERIIGEHRDDGRDIGQTRRPENDVFHLELPLRFAE